MKQLLILLASLALFACGGGDTGDSAEDAVAETVEETAETVGESISDAMHDVMEEAEDVGDILEEKKAALDDAIEDAEGAVTE